MLDAAGFPNVIRAFLEDEHVARAGSLSLQEFLLAVDGEHPENVVVELE
jgi:hypothetical protein